jgi:hypothetical protein
MWLSGSFGGWTFVVVLVEDSLRSIEKRNPHVLS